MYQFIMSLDLFLSQRRCTAINFKFVITCSVSSMPSSAEQTFRNNLSQFRWARDGANDSQHAQQPPPQGPFSRFYSSIGDYIPLRSTETSNEDEAWFALSRWERSVCLHLSKMVIANGSSQRHRLLGFIGSLVGAAVCFFVAFLTLPMLALKYSYLLRRLTPKLTSSLSSQTSKICVGI